LAAILVTTHLSAYRRSAVSFTVATLSLSMQVVVSVRVVLVAASAGPIPMAAMDSARTTPVRRTRSRRAVRAAGAVKGRLGRREESCKGHLGCKGSGEQ
jgi:hypothetical protein